VKLESEWQWAHEEFGHAEIEDLRRGRRLVDMATVAAGRPAGRITETFRGSAQRQGAYKLLETEKVSPTVLTKAMGVAGARRAAAEKFVFCPVDGSSLTLTDRAACKDFGPIGTRSQGARGLKVMNAMLLSPEGVPLGISAQEWWARPAKKPTKKHHDRLPPEEKEIDKWRTVMDTTRAIMGEHAPETRCWFQLDREGDAWPVLVQAGKDGHLFTIRATWNRRLLDSRNRKTYLRSSLARQPFATNFSLDVKASAKRSARTANMSVRACSVVLDLKDKKKSERIAFRVNVVHAVECGTTPRGEKRIEWLLFTNHRVDRIKDLEQILFGYSMRWRIEEFHRAWKRGVCRVEETQLRTTAAVIKWATILAAVAVRVERIKQMSREEPDRPASDEFSPEELQAIVILRFEKSQKNRPARGSVPTMAQATLWLAQLGGFAGSRNSGPPGAVTIARGLQDVDIAVRALKAAKAAAL
jgi:hypothetical protein